MAFRHKHLSRRAGRSPNWDPLGSRAVACPRPTATRKHAALRAPNSSSGRDGSTDHHHADCSRSNQHDLDAEWQAFCGSRLVRPDAPAWASPVDNNQGSCSGASGPAADDAATLALTPGSLNRGGPATTSGYSCSALGGNMPSLDDLDLSEEDFFLQFPCTSPASDGAAMCDLSAPLSVAAAAQQLRSDLLPVRTGGSWAGTCEVYVILFGVGQSETEGIYSLRGTADDGLPRETIIAFEAEEDAERYAGLLEAAMEHAPAVCSIPSQELLSFCSDAGYQARLEPCGSLLIPPEYNVSITDWERSLRLREGLYTVLEEEPLHAAALAAPPAAPSTAPAPASHHPQQHQQHPQQQAPGFGQLATPPAAASLAESAPPLNNHITPAFNEFSQAQLDGMRARLEALLPLQGGGGLGDAPPHHGGGSGSGGFGGGAGGFGGGSL